MKTGLSAALIALLALSAPCVVIAADEGEQAGSVTESTPAAGDEDDVVDAGVERRSDDGDRGSLADPFQRQMPAADADRGDTFASAAKFSI